MKNSGFSILYTPRVVLRVLLLVAMAMPAFAWGPKAQLAIVTTSLSLMTKEGNFPVSSLTDEFQAGALSSVQQLNALYPDLPHSPVDAVESEMYLLQAVSSLRIDPYFAYRLGALGKLVAELTSPMQGVTPTYRNLYYADVENAISGVTLNSTPRRVVNLRAYLPRRMQEANVSNAAIERGYRGGTGFAGVAQARLGEDTSRSVNAVADIWNTIFNTQALPGGVPSARLQAYVVDSTRFYVQRGNLQEIEAARARIGELTPKTTEMYLQLGDLLLEGGFEEQAITEYEAVQERDPDNRGVIEKIGNYYVRRGEAFIDAGALESGRDAFAKAVAANPLHATAEGRRLEAIGLIAARDERLDSARAAIGRAQDFLLQSQRESMRQRVAEAMSYLELAANSYYEVDDEFPVEYSERVRGLNAVRRQIQDLRLELVSNAQNLRGSGFALDLDRIAQGKNDALDTEILKTMIRGEYQAALGDLEVEMKSGLALE